jgi:putative membrane protein
MRKLITLTLPIALALGTTACGRQADQAQQATDAAANGTSEVLGDAGNVLGDAGNMASNAIDTAGQAVTPTPTGQDFVNRAAKSDAFEIAASKLAVDRASSPEIKSFAREMIDAHTASTKKIKAAASEATPAITPDATLTGDQNDKLADLGRLRGADFDKAYIAGQVSAHEDALSLMQSFAKDGDVPSLRTAAGEIAPIVQKHLERARTLKA